MNKHKWIEGVLVNDEYSTDEEMLKYFMAEGHMPLDEAKFYVSQRNEALRDPIKFRVAKG